MITVDDFVGGAAWTNTQPYLYTHPTGDPTYYEYGSSFCVEPVVREDGIRAWPHPGVDIGVALGTSLFCPVEGVVIIAGNSKVFTDERYGTKPRTGQLKIRTDSGEEVIIGHMEWIDVDVGDRVTLGQAIGRAGTDNGPHAHVEVRLMNHLECRGGLKIVDPFGTVLGAALPLHAGYELLWSAGETRNYDVLVTNSGSRSWPHLGENRVRLSVSFGKQSDEEHVDWATEERFELPQDVAPGEEAPVSVSVRSPPTGGAYVLRHRMVHEHVQWFTELDRTPVRVKGQPTAGARADYRFQQSLVDTLGNGRAMAQIGPDAGEVSFITDTVDGQQRVVLHYPWNVGLRVPLDDILPDPGVYTIAILFKPETTGGYVRVLDFKNGTVDFGVYLHGGGLMFYNKAPASGVSFADGSYHQAVVTRDAAGRLAGYVDGSPSWIDVDDTGRDGVFDAGWIRLFRDNETGGHSNEASAGNVARIRMYPHALTAAQVAALEIGR